MYDELQEELDDGTRAALALAEHLRGMGAAGAALRVKLDGEQYELIIQYEGFVDELIKQESFMDYGVDPMAARRRINELEAEIATLSKHSNEARELILMHWQGGGSGSSTPNRGAG